VLLQLPFEPNILHQWTVALMVEAMRFRIKITDFSTTAYPEHLYSVVRHLLSIACVLHSGADRFLSFCAKLINSLEPSTDEVYAAASLYWEKFQAYLPEVLAALKFALSEECDTVISALKHLAWKDNAAERQRKSFIKFSQLPSVYARIYWNMDALRGMLFADEIGLEVDIPGLLEIDLLVAKKESTVSDELKNLIVETILKPGRIQGESVEVILETAAKFEELEVYNIHYRHHEGKKNLYCKFIGVKVSHYLGLLVNLIFEHDKGVIYDILLIYAELKTKEVLALLTQSLLELVQREVPTSKIYIDLKLSDGPEMELEEIHSKLDKAL